MRADTSPARDTGVSSPAAAGLRIAEERDCTHRDREGVSYPRPEFSLFVARLAPIRRSDVIAEHAPYSAATAGARTWCTPLAAR